MRIASSIIQIEIASRAIAEVESSVVTIEGVPQPQPPAGWYPDPGSGHLRWWDGAQWGVFAPPIQPQLVVARPLKDTTTTYLLALFLGGFGVHNFYLGRTGVATTQLILSLVGLVASAATTGGGALNIAVLVWVIVELFLIPGFVREANARIAGLSYRR